MGTHKNTITINGKVFDTVTGRPVDSLSHKSSQIVRPTKVPKAVSGTSHASHQKHAIKVNDKLEEKAVRIEVKREGGVKAHNVHHKTHRSNTLMRNLVKHPKNQTRPTKVTTIASQPDKIFYRQGNPNRDLRASINLKNHKIAKYIAHDQKVKHKIEHIPVKSSPRESSDDSVYVVKTAPPILNTKPHGHEASRNMFDNALRDASFQTHSSIGSKKVKKAGKHLIRLSSSIAVVVLLFLFFAYHNQTGLALRSANSKAGFKASLPKYKPVGYKLDRSIESGTGQVILKYVSNTGGNGFELKQMNVGSNAESYATNIARQRKNTLTSITESGLKIYIYGNSSAAWTKNGIVYNIQGHDNLSSQQLVKFASSI